LEWEKVTPYVHILAFHTIDVIKRYGTITLFSQQGYEHPNKIERIYYFRSTTRGSFSDSSTYDLLMKILRVFVVGFFSKLEDFMDFSDQLHGYEGEILTTKDSSSNNITSNGNVPQQTNVSSQSNFTQTIKDDQVKIDIDQ